MLIVGLTGSTGSGKGYVSEIFVKNGIPCLDTDAVCRLVYEKGQKCYEELADYFGECILDVDGNIDRSALFSVSFSYPEKYAKLEEIAFSHILAYTKNWLKENEKNGVDISIIDAPMLFESGFDKMCDKTVAVLADRETQISRVMRRDGIDAEKAEKRLEKQKTNDFFISRCDFIIDNSHINGDKVGDKVNEVTSALRRIAADKD